MKTCADHQTKAEQLPYGEGSIKIGTARNVERRLRNLAACNAGSLMVLATMIGGRSAEAALHRHFRRWRLHGEWFRPVRPLLSLIDRLKEAP